MTSAKEDIANYLEKMEGHLDEIANSQAEINDKGGYTSFGDAEAASITKSLESIANDEYDVKGYLESIAQSLKTLVELKQEKQRRHRNGPNYSPSQKHSKNLKRSLTTTADGRKVSGKITFSRTGKRLFIQNKHGYTSA